MGMNENGVPGGNYAQAPDAAFPGMLVDTRIAKNIESHASAEVGIIGFGFGVVRAIGAALLGCVRLPALNIATAAGSGPLGASNSSVVTVNGEATTATVYASSHAATMEAIAVKVRLLPHVVSAVVSTNDLIITLDDVDATITFVVTGGSAVTYTYTYTSADSLAGLAVYTPKEGTLPTPEQPSETVEYQLHDTVDTLTMGALWAKLAAGILPTTVSPAYVVTADTADRGKLTNVSTGNIRCGTFRPDLDENSFASAGGCIPVELINPRVAA